MEVCIGRRKVLRLYGKYTNDNAWLDFNFSVKFRKLA